MTTLSQSLTIRHPMLQQLLDKWIELCSDTVQPIAEDLDVSELRPWLDHMVLVTLQDSGQAVYSYYSPTFAEAFEGDKVGQTLDSLPPIQRQILQSEYDLIKSERRPMSRIYRAEFNGEFQTWERLVMPFFSEEGQVRKILVAAYRLAEVEER